MLGARQILTLCREKRPKGETEAGAFPVLFSTSVMHFNTGLTSARTAQRADAGRAGSSGSRAIEEAMRRLAKLSLQGTQQHQQNRPKEEEFVIEAWDSTELSLLSGMNQSASDEGNGEKPHTAWLCTRFKIHQPSAQEQEQADQPGLEVNKG